MNKHTGAKKCQRGAYACTGHIGYKVAKKAYHGNGQYKAGCVKIIYKYNR